MVSDFPQSEITTLCACACVAGRGDIWEKSMYVCAHDVGNNSTRLLLQSELVLLGFLSAGRCSALDLKLRLIIFCLLVQIFNIR